MDLKDFSDVLKNKKKVIDTNLAKYIISDDYPPNIHKAMHYAIFNGGKRLRPIMVLEGAVLSGINPNLVLPTACALELIHCYSLVHDDLPAMDDDELRRGKPTCHIVFGEDIAILTGDALLTLAFELVASNSKAGIDSINVVKVIREISKAAGSKGMIGGQVIDLESEGKTIDFETLKTLHSLKTGELFRVALVSGAILGGMNEEKIILLEKYAYHFGQAFQITDDILDIRGDVISTGKPVGSDEKNNKTTYPELFGVDKSLQLAQDNIKTCLDSLEGFGEEADFLRKLAKYVLYRKS
ncbi:MAG TPA: farnesyl diphosphate synthase [Syntrophomonadaceae bacterium]|nr:farnesyl diphosphate synthase [Syntrophomonadaceae bacterium]